MASQEMPSKQDSSARPRFEPARKRRQPGYPGYPGYSPGSNEIYWRGGFSGIGAPGRSADNDDTHSR